jgi:hypothetical protein
MWKLVATALAIADTGSMSISSIATDFVDRASCESAAAQLFSGTVDRELAGRRITIRTAGQCVPGAPPATVPIPFFGPIR